MSTNTAEFQAETPPRALQANGYHVDPPSRPGEPTWEMASFFPRQGEWTEADYLALDTNRPIELSEGCLEFLPMPTLFHQAIALYLYEVLKTFVVGNGIEGVVSTAPVRIRLWPGKIRLPDVNFVRPDRIVNRREPPNGVDLAMEVVSEGPEDRKRDLETKRLEYARASVPEYWIVDPEDRSITVLTLDGPAYREHGRFSPGMSATSVLLPGFTIDVSAVFQAAQA